MPMNDEPSNAPAPVGTPVETAIIGRRDFLRMAAALGLTWRIGADGVGHLWAQPAPGQTCTGPASPEVTGDLSEREAAAMWSIFEYVGRTWDTARFCRITSPAGLRPVLHAKTSIEPSYLTEYRRAVAILDELVRQYGQDEGMRRFLFSNPDVCTRQLVIAELVMLQVTQGGFRRFGYVNYAGFMGGPFNDSDHLPYRSYRDARPAGGLSHA